MRQQDGTDQRRQNIYTKRKKQVQHQKKALVIIAMITIGAFSVFFSAKNKKNPSQSSPKAVHAEQKEQEDTSKKALAQIKKNAQEKGYPQEVVDLLDKNEETASFVEGYGKRKNMPCVADIGGNLEKGQIPELLQWDERWGYAPYGTSILAVSGCGPTCMAMVVSGLMQDTGITPWKMAQYAGANNYIDEKNNTYWTFMEEAGADWNINCTGGVLDEEQLKAQLEAGHPAICSMSPGDFTDTGHFIVLASYVDGKIKVNDPFSIKNTKKGWTYAEIVDQIKAMWVYERMDES